MTSKKQLLDAQRKYSEEAAPALESLITETMRRDGPINALAWLATMAVSFLVCLGLLMLVTAA